MFWLRHRRRRGEWPTTASRTARGGEPTIVEYAYDALGRRLSIWLQDQARIGQQGTLTRVRVRRGTRPERVRQCRYDWLYLNGCVNPLTGKSSCMLAPTVNTEWMNAHLQIISKGLAGDDHGLLVLDNAGWHTSRELAVPANLTLRPLPTYSPQPSGIERLWLYMKQHYLANQIYRDYAHIDRQCTYAHSQLTPELIRSVCNTPWINDLKERGLIV